MPLTKKDVQTGSYYACRVGESVVAIKITREHHRQGWYAINLTTRKEVRIATAQRLRWPLTEAEARAFGKQLPQIAEIRRKMLAKATAASLQVAATVADLVHAAGLPPVENFDDNEEM